jgi:hypothetical protein
MRNILITVMMLLVAAFLFSNIITDDTNGLKPAIEEKGANARTEITNLDVD